MQSSSPCRISLHVSMVSLSRPFFPSFQVDRIFYQAILHRQARFFEVYHLHKRLVAWLKASLGYPLLGLVIFWTLPFLLIVHRLSCGGRSLFLSQVIRDCCHLSPCLLLQSSCACCRSLVPSVVLIHRTLLPPLHETS